MHRHCCDLEVFIAFLNLADISSNLPQYIYIYIYVFNNPSYIPNSVFFTVNLSTYIYALYAGVENCVQVLREEGRMLVVSYTTQDFTWDGIFSGDVCGW